MTRNAAVVFGGSRGIGAAIAATPAREGFDVASTNISNAPGAAEVEGARTEAYKADIRDVEAVAGPSTR